MKKFVLFFMVLFFSVSVFAEKRKYKNTVIKNPKKWSPEWVVLKTLEAGVNNTFDDWYAKFCHSNLCIGTGKNMSNMKKYMWKRFLKWAKTYFVSLKEKSYKVVYTRPAEFDENTKEIKFFIKNFKRDNPVPIILRKDKDGKYKVYNSSL